MGVRREGKALANTGRHNHQLCVAEALHRAETVCKDSGARMTSLRRMVLEQVWRGHDAVKAYDILAWLGRKRRSANPPTVYRALQFLQREGLVHRLESLNAFVGCSQPRGNHQGQFLICGKCGQVSEMEAREITRLVSESAKAKGFITHRQTIEVHGVCGQCA